MHSCWRGVARGAAALVETRPQLRRLLEYSCAGDGDGWSSRIAGLIQRFRVPSVHEGALAVVAREGGEPS